LSPLSPWGEGEESHCPGLLRNYLNWSKLLVSAAIDRASFLAKLPLEIGQIVQIVLRSMLFPRWTQCQLMPSRQQSAHHREIILDISHQVQRATRPQHASAL